MGRANKPTEDKSDRNSSDQQDRGLYHHSVIGPRMRTHRYWRELAVFLRPASLAASLQTAVYLYVLIRANRSDWVNIGVTVLAISLVPFLTAAVLTAFRRNEAPIATGVIVGVAIFSMVVSVLSALRVPISYTALLWCLPISTAISTYANLRFNRLKNLDHVAIAPFPDMDETMRGIDGVTYLSGPTASVEGVQTLLIDPLYHHSAVWSGLLSRCYLLGVEIVPWTRYAEVRFGRLDVRSFDVSHLVYTPSQLLYARCKRFFDLACVLLTLPITLPLALLTGLYILARDGGPVIFVQIRRGHGGRRFRMYKFRTMYNRRTVGVTRKNDDRIIPGCKTIRKYRLDELPQLFNVILGDMSIIGPRPVAEQVARETEREEPKYALRTLVLPGITGWAQVTSGYAENTIQEVEKLSYDLYYLKHLSFDLDFLVLFKTIRTVLLGSGAR